MRGIRLTKAEVEVVREAFGDWRPLKPAWVKATASLLAKLDAAEEAPKGVNPGPLEQALVVAARGKVVPLGQGGMARASRQATAAGATPEDAALVGNWMARQGWLHGPQTLLDVLNKWPQWLAKAKASAPPDPLKPGLGVTGEAGRSSEGAGSVAPGRLRQGFKG